MIQVGHFLPVEPIIIKSMFLAAYATTMIEVYSFYTQNASHQFGKLIMEHGDNLMHQIL